MNDFTALGNKLAKAEGQLEGWRVNESAALDRCNLARNELQAMQTNADPAKAAALSKSTAKLRQQLAEDESLLQDARDISNRLEGEIATLHQQLLARNTQEQRQAAVRDVAKLAALAKPIEAAVDELAAALAKLRDQGARARVAIDAVLGEMHTDQMRLDDACALISPRAGAVGPEMGAAIAAILAKLAQAAGAPIEPHLVFNDFYPGSGTLTAALNTGAQYVASRLGVRS